MALTAIDLKHLTRMQGEKGRDSRLRRLARRNRDVAWLLAEHQRLAATKPKKAKPTETP